MSLVSFTALFFTGLPEQDHTHAHVYTPWLTILLGLLLAPLLETFVFACCLFVLDRLGALRYLDSFRAIGICGVLGACFGLAHGQRGYVQIAVLAVFGAISVAIMLIHWSANYRALGFAWGWLLHQGYNVLALFWSLIFVHMKY